MKINESMSINEFMSRDFKKEREIKNKKIGKIALRVVISGSIIYLTGFDVASAADGAIEKAGDSIYEKLLSVGKWVIIIKGGIDTVNNASQGDFPAAKKSFLSYLITYIVLNALPWAMDQVDLMFEGDI